MLTVSRTFRIKKFLNIFKSINYYIILEYLCSFCFKNIIINNNEILYYLNEIFSLIFYAFLDIFHSNLFVFVTLFLDIYFFQVFAITDNTEVNKEHRS